MAIIHRAIPLSGGSGGLNFEVVGSTTAPTNPSENTIWINTSTAIGEYQMSFVMPAARVDGSALIAGDIWIQTGNANTVSINALKKNALHMDIIRACQWDGSAWSDKTVKCYINGNWKDTILYIFSASYGIDKDSSSWSQYEINSFSSFTPTYIRVASNGYSYGNIIDSIPRDVTNYSSLNIKVTRGIISDAWGAYLGIVSSDEDDVSFVKSAAITGEGTFTLDLSDATGSYYIKIRSGEQGAAEDHDYECNQIQFSELWLE